MGGGEGGWVGVGGEGKRGEAHEEEPFWEEAGGEVGGHFFWGCGGRGGFLEAG